MEKTPTQYHFPFTNNNGLFGFLDHLTCEFFREIWPNTHFDDPIKYSVPKLLGKNNLPDKVVWSE